MVERIMNIDIKFIKENEGGIIGMILILFLIVMTCYALFLIPVQLRLHWTNPHLLV